jgi:hypothetical protein
MYVSVILCLNWEVHLAFWLVEPEGKTQLGRPVGRWGMILKRILKKWDAGLKCTYLTYKHGN